MGKRNTAFHKADIRDIERDLVEACEGERLGVTQSTASANLFYLDPKGKVDAPQFIAERNRAWKLGELTMDRILKAQSAITIQPQRLRPAKGKIAKIVAKKSFQKGKGERPLHPTVYDLWAKELSPTEEAFNQLLPHTRAKGSVYPAVPLPDAFESYHPEAVGHLAHLVELEAKEHLKLARKGRKTILKSLEQNGEQQGDNMIERANKELLVPHQEPSEPEDQIDASLTNNKFKTRKKKTIPERNKIQMRKRQQREALLAKQKRTITAQLNDLKHLRQHADALQVATLKEGKQFPSSLAPAKRVGSRKLLQAPLAIKLPKEQAGSLRLLVPELNPVKERFRSLAERALIEPTGSIVDKSRRKRLKRSLPGYKEYTKPSHRD